MVSVIWIGSRSWATDVHAQSDFDIQIIMDRPDLDASLALADIIAVFTDVDLSIMYLDDIYGPGAVLDFQDGTKGLFFMNVLASGTVLHGEDVYGQAAARLTLADLAPSLTFTVREYLSRLRSMTLQGEPAPFHFKKYSLKLLKDVLLLAGRLDPQCMAHVSNQDVLDDARQMYAFGEEVDAALTSITDFSRSYSPREKAVILAQLEELVRGVRW
ncbi:hypothetical protein [Blastococcus capsensis]|uniref:hypothetical protein n=1 Tax=Blastococcus capsensis TaxID=1564163 RepID=UPI00253FC911|nr:hypothetical protein [Blastococcus capsensis]MDK3257013.1 hypothetical protein [Blastococcus capsensis]